MEDIETMIKLVCYISHSSAYPCSCCVQMAVAAVAHIYIFPATPYQVLEGGKDRNVKVLADYAAFDSPLDPEEVRESERPSMVKFFGVDVEKGATSVKESVHDVLVVGGHHVREYFAMWHFPSIQVLLAHQKVVQTPNCIWRCLLQ